VSPRCLVCGGEYALSRIPGLLECRTCAFVTANLTLSSAELARLYTAEYFAGQEYLNYVGERALIQRHFAGRLQRLLPYVPNASNKRLFEIGSAHGFFLHVAKPHFRSVAGIDISAAASGYARDVLDLPVATGDFLDLRLPDCVDVVCLWDTIEHLQHPDRYLEKAVSRLNPGGVIALTTGDIGSVVARLRGAKWRQIHPPTHLHYFSRATLQRLLERLGLVIAYTGYDGQYRSVDTMAYILLTIKQKRPAMYAALKRTGLLNWNLYLNLYDIVFVIARKP
jgi:SAM-dependent methyltransferase